MPYGYTGNIAVINLTNGTVETEQRPESFYRKILGGEGLGAWLINEKVPLGADPLGADNGLCVATGFCTDSNAPASPRVMVMTKSPITGGFGDSNAGGAFGPELKRCGFDALYITGAAKEPVYLHVAEDGIEIRPAGNLWGMDTVQTKQALIEEYDDSKIKVAAIGKCGEQGSLIAAILFDDRAAARSGVGAVMGSKNLKCIVARGSKKVPMADAELVKQSAKTFRDFIKTTDYFVIKTMRDFGSCGFMSIGIKAGIGPIKNWQLAGEEHYPQHEKINGASVTKYRKKRHGCLTCPIVCGGSVDVDEGDYQCSDVRLPEYETIQAFAPFVMCDDIEACFKAQEFCDKAGIDTISCGHAVAFAVELFDRGILTIEDTDGLELGWGKTKEIIELTRRICDMEEGIGRTLADGVMRAAQRIGRGSEKYAVHIGGQEPAFHDYRYEASSRGVTYIADPTPARHERCSGGQLLQLGMPLGPYPEVTPDGRPDPLDFETLGRLYALGAKYYSAFSSCGFCAYTLGASAHLDVVGLIRGISGWDDYTIDEYLDAGERAHVLRQIFSLREGLTPDKMYFPPRMLEKPLFEGAMRGTDKDIDWEALRDKFYAGLGWSCDGVPDVQRLEGLGIMELVKGGLYAD